MCKLLNSFFGERPKFVQSMNFEGNSATWEHQDSYYLDDEKTGKMIAGWLALEDIKRPNFIGKKMWIRQVMP